MEAEAATGRVGTMGAVEVVSELALEPTAVEAVTGLVREDAVDLRSARRGSEVVEVAMQAAENPAKHSSTSRRARSQGAVECKERCLRGHLPMGCCQSEVGRCCEQSRWSGHFGLSRRRSARSRSSLPTVRGAPKTTARDPLRWIGSAPNAALQRHPCSRTSSRPSPPTVSLVEETDVAQWVAVD